MPAFEPRPMFIIIIPMAGAIPSRTPIGMASNSRWRTLHSVRIMNNTPSNRMITSAVWNDSRYVMPVIRAMLATTSAKKLFSPMPGAMAKGRLARSAMQNVPSAEAMHVAMNTPFHRDFPSAPKLVSKLGLSATM